jgi:hypothetical protein
MFHPSFGLENPGTRVPLPMFCLFIIPSLAFFSSTSTRLCVNKTNNRDVTAFSPNFIPITIICFNGACFLMLTVSYCLPDAHRRDLKPLCQQNKQRVLIIPTSDTTACASSLNFISHSYYT